MEIYDLPTGQGLPSALYIQYLPAGHSVSEGRLNLSCLSQSCSMALDISYGPARWNTLDQEKERPDEGPAITEMYGFRHNSVSSLGHPNIGAGKA